MKGRGRLGAPAGRDERSGNAMEQHLTILGVLHIAWSAIGILTALVVFMAVAGGGMLSGDIEVMTVTSTIGTLVAFLLLILNLPGLIGGIGILKQYQWARILTLVVGFLYMIIIPFGTMLGIYTAWVLLSNQTRNLFERSPGSGE
jgi:hypothetical protein